MGALVMGGVLVASFLGNDSEQKPSAMPNPAGVSTAAKMNHSRHPACRSIGMPAPQTNRLEARRQLRKPLPLNQKSPKSQSKPRRRPLPHPGKPSTAWESYEIVQPTRVFSAPSEHSQLVANVEPGTQVNVVDSRNGWLEIRSKHGRPPGFIEDRGNTNWTEQLDLILSPLVFLVLTSDGSQLRQSWVSSGGSPTSAVKLIS